MQVIIIIITVAIPSILVCLVCITYCYVHSIDRIANKDSRIANTV
jgi:hypothetical protein